MYHVTRFHAYNVIGYQYCSGSSCLYIVNYGDGSYTSGYYAKDTHLRVLIKNKKIQTDTNVFSHIGYLLFEVQQATYILVAVLTYQAQTAPCFPNIIHRYISTKTWLV
jgi:hypothetical protein